MQGYGKLRTMNVREGIANEKEQRKQRKMHKNIKFQGSYRKSYWLSDSHLALAMLKSSLYSPLR